MTREFRGRLRALPSNLLAALGRAPAPGPPLLGPPAPGALLDQVHGSKTTLLRLLEQNILPFWYPRVLDHDHGGYLVHHDAHGRWKGPAPKHLVVQARVLWFFSRLARAGYGERFLEAAATGFAFLRDSLWDPGEGGFFWAVDHGGTTTVIADKRAYGQAFGLYAAAEYAAASGDAGAVELALTAWEHLEGRFHDPVAGGYFSLPAGRPGRGLISLEGLKSQNDHLHILEALTTLWRVAPTPLVRDRIWETMMALSSAVVRKRDGVCTEGHRSDWAPLAAGTSTRVSYGHDVEGAWLLLESCDALGIPAALLADHAMTMVTTMLRFGVDRRHGGVYASGPVGRRADDRRKIWWVQAEALVACLDLYARSGLPGAGEAYLSILDWIVTAQADWQAGEWHETILSGGEATGDKAGPWKGPYHSGRAMLACLDRLRRLPPPFRE